MKKRLMALLLVFALVLTNTVTVFAEESGESDTSVGIEEIEEAESSVNEENVDEKVIPQRNVVTRNSDAEESTIESVATAAEEETVETVATAAEEETVESVAAATEKEAVETGDAATEEETVETGDASAANKTTEIENAAEEKTDSIGITTASEESVMDCNILSTEDNQDSTINNNDSCAVNVIINGKVDLMAAKKWVTSGYTAASSPITLSGIYYFDQSTELPPIIVGTGGLTMIIKDGVTIQVGYYYYNEGYDFAQTGDYAGIIVEDDQKPLVITAGTDEYGKTPQGTGVLEAYGASGGAGIGGRSGYDGGFVTIEGATVKAYGGTFTPKNADDEDTQRGGAGIGGGRKGRGIDIEINGGTVYAYGGYCAAGIGSGDAPGGKYGNPDGTENIEINGGTVYAYGDYCSAGIGGGYYTIGADITINQNIKKEDGTYVETYVYAESYLYGSGIGGGCNIGHDITITGGTVRAYGSSGGAGIGAGDGARAYDITISGGDVEAYGYNGGAGIGGGSWGSSESEDSRAKEIWGVTEDITISGGKVTAISEGEGEYDDEHGAGIGGGGHYAEVSSITISGGTIIAKSEGAGAGIGSGGNGYLMSDPYGIRITGGNITAESADGGAGIGGGYLDSVNDIEISGENTVINATANNGAGIGGGSDGSAYDITISGGTITATSRGNGAGIGAGWGKYAKRITISGGTIVAKSMNEGAGIGAGSGGNLIADSYGIRITGGNITADSADGGAGIGAGYTGDAEGIEISGSDTVIHATANNGAGIGGGSGGGKAEDITIDDGYIIAESGGLGAGIGSGKGGKTAESIYINGGYVEACGGTTKTVKSWGDGSGCAIGVGYFDTNKTEPNEDIYVSTGLKMERYYDGTWAEFGHNGDDLAHYAQANYMKYRYVRISDVESRSIELGTQQSIPTYGDASESVYELTTSYVSGREWTFRWYQDDKEISEAPADITVSGSEVKVTYNGTSDAGSYAFTVSCDGITSDKAAYTVNKRDVTITSGSASKVYDGTALVCEDYEIEGFVDGEGVNVICTGSMTNAVEIVEVSGTVDGEGNAAECMDLQTETAAIDSVPNTFTYTAKPGTNLNNYNIKEITGILKVLNQLFVVSGTDYYGTYDGVSHEFTVKVIGKNGVDFTNVTGLTIEYKESSDGTNWSDWTTSPVTIKDAGTKYVRAMATRILPVSGKEVTLESDVYTMTVTPRNVVLTSESAEKEYDATPLTANNGGKRLTADIAGDVAISGDGFVDSEDSDFEFVFDSSSTITKVGSVENKFECSKKSDSEVLESNYSFEYIYGELVIIPKSASITITTPSISKLYDGKYIDAETTENSVTYTQDVLADGDTLTVDLYCSHDGTGENDFDGRVKETGTYKNDIESYIVTNASGEDVTDCYTFARPVIGKLTISKRKITLTSGSQLKVYETTGDCAYNNNVTVSGDGLLEGDELTYSGFPTVTEISYTPTSNAFEYVAAEESGFNADNYDITVETGYLMLVEEMYIVGEELSFTYDGNEHEVPVTLIDNGQGADVEITYSTSTDNKTWSEYSTDVPSVKDAGTLYVKAKATKGVQVKEASYTVTVNKRSVILKSGSSSKQYDGTALICTDYEIAGDGFASGEGFDKINIVGTTTDVGTAKNNFDSTTPYELNQSTNASNYNIYTSAGTLAVTRNLTPILITTGSDSWTYNGMALGNTEITVTWDGQALTDGKLFGNDVLQAVPTGSITDVGTVDNTCDYKVIRDGNIDVTDYYTFAEPDYGTLEVTSRSIIIHTGSASKTYDGTALTAHDYFITGDGFVDGDGFETVNFTGTRTSAGTAVNELDENTPYTFNDVTTAKNYNVTVVPGTLTVNKRKVTVTSGSAVCTLESLPDGGLTNTSVCTVTGDGFVSGELEDGYPKGCGIQDVLGESENTIEYKWTSGANTANYEFTENPGRLVVVDDSAASAVAADYVGIYDGEYHDGTFITAIENPDTIEYKIDGTALKSGETPAVKDVKRDESGNISSYKVEVTVTKGNITASCTYNITINPRELTLTAGSAEKVYDGTPLTCSEYTIDGDGFANETEKNDANVQTEGEITDVYEVDGEICAVTNCIKQLDKITDTFNPANYEITYADGALKITRRQVTLISLGFAREYENIPESVKIKNGNKYDEYDLNPITYDGKNHSREVVIDVGTGQVQGIDKISEMGFVDGEGVKYSDFTEIQDSGLYENTFKYEAKSGTDLNNYEIKCIYGLMRILPCEVTLTSGSSAKKYDGEALTNDSVDIKTSLEDNKMPYVSVLKRAEIEFNVTGSQTRIGKSANTFDYEITNYKEINYKVTKVEGTLEVYDDDTLRIVVPENREYTYDGKAHGEAAKAYIGDELCDETIWYSTDGGKTFTDEVPQLTEVGTLNVTVLAEKTGYKKAEGNYTISVVAAKASKSSRAVATGDSNDMTLWIVLLAVAVLALVGTVLIRKKSN